MSFEFYSVLSFALNALLCLLFAKILLRWYIMFGVLNEKNEFVIRAQNAVDAIFKPITDPIKRAVPEIYGIDLSLVVVLIVMVGLRFLLNQFLV